jgi:hypothetical protein
MAKTLYLVAICKPGGTVNRVPVDTWAARMRLAGHTVTVQDPDEIHYGGTKFDHVLIDELAAQKASG